MNFRDKVKAAAERQQTWHPTCKACKALREIQERNSEVAAEVKAAMEEANEPGHYSTKEITWEAIVKVLCDDYQACIPDGRSLSRHYQAGHFNG